MTISLRDILEELTFYNDGQLNDLIAELEQPGRMTYRAHVKLLLAHNERSERHWQYHHKLNQGEPA